MCQESERAVREAQEATVAALGEVKEVNEKLNQLEGDLAAEKEGRERVDLLMFQVKGVLDADIGNNQRVSQIRNLLKDVG